MRTPTWTDLAVLDGLPTAVLADAVVRLRLPVRHAPAGITGRAGVAIAGRALPVRHAGSVDVFLEVLERATQGDVLVIDNGGRRDEACIGDLVALEARAAGVSAIVVWGLHRDAPEIAGLGLPVFSYGTLPFGPLAARAPDPPARRSARFGDALVTRDDVVVADPDGVLFVPADQVGPVATAAGEIRDMEARQVRRLRAGTPLREQLDLAGYLRARADHPRWTFRDHLRALGRAVEE